MKKFTPVIVLFVAVNLLLLLVRHKLAGWSIEESVVFTGNLIIFMATMAAAYLYSKASANEKPLGFLQQFYGGFLLKFMILIIAVALYLFTVPEPNQNGIIVCMALYLLYHFLGTVSATRKSPRKSA